MAPKVVVEEEEETIPKEPVGVSDENKEVEILENPVAVQAGQEN